MKTDELQQILLDHAARYPAMEPTDGVKLIYQNEFGGGHLIKDEAACLAYLRREYELVEKSGQVPLYESIGNGIVRVNLAAVQETDLEKLGQAFIRSAAIHQGNLESFKEKLGLLRQMTQQHCFGFSSEALEAYLEAYEKAGFPPVSHSESYRAAYHPAYRIVCK